MSQRSLSPFIIRPAVKSDFIKIKSLVHQVRINPTGLVWRQFVVAFTAQNELIGCGQVKPHRDGSYELASLAVFPEWRGRDVAKSIISCLLAMYPCSIYLTCRSGLGDFYERFGFRVITTSEMPPYFRRIYRLVGVIQAFRTTQETLLVMRKD